MNPQNPEPTYGKRLHRAARQDFKAFWSAHRLWAVLSTLAVTVVVIAIQVAYRGIGSMANVEQTVVSGVIGLGVSLIGNYLIAMRRGAETIDARLRNEIPERDKEVGEQQAENRRLEDRLAAPTVSTLEQSRRDLVREMLESFTQEERIAVTYILKHGHVDSMTLVTDIERKDQPSFSSAIPKGLAKGLLAHGTTGGQRVSLIVNPDLIGALSHYLLTE